MYHSFIRINTKVLNLFFPDIRNVKSVIEDSIKKLQKNKTKKTLQMESSKVGLNLIDTFTIKKDG